MDRGLYKKYVAQAAGFSAAMDRFWEPFQEWGNKLPDDGGRADEIFADPVYVPSKKKEIDADLLMALGSLSSMFTLFRSIPLMDDFAAKCKKDNPSDKGLLHVVDCIRKYGATIRYMRYKETLGERLFLLEDLVSGEDVILCSASFSQAKLNEGWMEKNYMVLLLTDGEVSYSAGLFMSPVFSVGELAEYYSLLTGDENSNFTPDKAFEADFVRFSYVCRYDIPKVYHKKEPLEICYSKRKFDELPEVMSGDSFLGKWDFLEADGGKYRAHLFSVPEEHLGLLKGTGYIDDMGFVSPFVYFDTEAKEVTVEVKCRSYFTDTIRYFQKIYPWAKNFDTEPDHVFSAAFLTLLHDAGIKSDLDILEEPFEEMTKPSAQEQAQLDRMNKFSARIIELYNDGDKIDIPKEAGRAKIPTELAQDLYDHLLESIERNTPHLKLKDGDEKYVFPDSLKPYPNQRKRFDRYPADNPYLRISYDASSMRWFQSLASPEVLKHAWNFEDITGFLALEAILVFGSEEECLRVLNTLLYYLCKTKGEAQFARSFSLAYAELYAVRYPEPSEIIRKINRFLGRTMVNYGYVEFVDDVPRGAVLSEGTYRIKTTEHFDRLFSYRK